MAEHNELGVLGENIAIKYLASNGYDIKEKNWRDRHKEIDIIAQKNNTLVIVEVKARQGNCLIEPYLAVDRKKQSLLISAANTYIEKNNLDIDVQFDILSIIVSGTKHRIDHIKDAFYPTA